MFGDSRGAIAQQVDTMAVVLEDIEEWLDTHGYDIAEIARTGELSLDEPGYSVVAENDSVTIAYLGDEDGDAVLRTYPLEEIWSMDESEFRDEIDELAVEG